MISLKITTVIKNDFFFLEFVCWTEAKSMWAFGGSVKVKLIL